MNMHDIFMYSVLSGAAYADNVNQSLSEQLASTTLSNQFSTDPNSSAKYLIKDFSTTSAPNNSGFAATVVQDKATNQVTIAFRGTEPSLSDYSTDALAIASGVAAGQIVDMYNYVNGLRYVGDVTQYCQ